MVTGNVPGLVLAVSSSAFIGTSFILKKKGLRRAAASGTRAGVGGYTYLLEPLWWAGMITMFIGEVANFVAYVYAPAVLVTPLGALSIIIRYENSVKASLIYYEMATNFQYRFAWYISAVLAHFMLKERLPKLGILGCVCCIVGSVVIVLHAPQEQSPTSVIQIWGLATEPAFLIYVVATSSMVVILVFYFEKRYGQSNMLIYLGICSLIGSLTVVSIKAIGIAVKLTLEGINQLQYVQSWFFLSVAAVCVITQLNYLNKALDTFNAAVVSPVYYVMFTTLSIVASAIMFKDWSGQDASSIASEICGFITVLCGTIILHATREQEQTNTSGTAGSGAWYGSNRGSRKSGDEEQLIGVHSSDLFD
ncbi:putative magnesium transporter NIPA6 [Drosera capensis]